MHTLRYHVCAMPTEELASLTNCSDARKGDLPVEGGGITAIAHETVSVEESVRVVN